MLCKTLSYYYKFTYLTFVTVNVETHKKSDGYHCGFGNCQNTQ